jgi:hypothetical protein
MMALLSHVRVARCRGALVVLALSRTTAAESLANARSILAPTMDSTHHLA